MALALASARADITAIWNGGAGNWTDPAHWSTSPFFPNNNPPILYDVEINGGTVTIDQEITIDQLTFGGGMLGGTFSLTVIEGMQWSAGTIRGSGTLVLAGTSAIVGGVQPLVLDGRTINHSGSATFSAGTIRGGFGATLNNLAGAMFTALGEAAFFSDPASPDWTINNAGTFAARSISGVGFTSMDAVFHNSGTVRIELAGLALAHTLSLAGGGTHSGLIDLPSGAAVEFGNGTMLQSGTTITGAGTAFVAGEVIVSGSISAENLAIAVGELKIETGTVSIGHEAWQTGGTVRLDDGTLRVADGGGTFVLDGGALMGSGTLEAGLDVFGEVAPGATLGSLSVTGDAAFASEARLTIELGGTVSGSFDVLAIAGVVTLGGELRVSLTNGFTAGPADTFTILTGSTVRGFFLNAMPPGLGNTGHLFFAGGEADVTYHDDSVVLSNVIPEPSLPALVALGAAIVGAGRRERRRSRSGMLTNSHANLP